jgi:hypothetical protein
VAPCIVLQFASMPPHPEIPAALRRLLDHGFRLITLTDNTLAISGRQLEHAGVIDVLEHRFSVDETMRRHKGRTTSVGTSTRSRTSSSANGTSMPAVIVTGSASYGEWSGPNRINLNCRTVLLAAVSSTASPAGPQRLRLTLSMPLTQGWQWIRKTPCSAEV